MNGFEKRTQEKKARVLQSAFDLINTSQGVAGLTMAAVAKASGTAKATIFKYFESKEKLIQQVFIDYMEDLGQQAEIMLAQPMSFEEKLVTMAKLKVRHLERVDQQFFVDMMDLYTQEDDPELAAVMAAYTKRSYNLMLDLFHQGRKEGKIDLKYSDEFLMLYMEAMVRGVAAPEIYRQINIHYTEDWTEMLMKSLAPKPR